MKPLQLTMAMGDYDQTRDLAYGTVRAEGIELRYLNLPLEEIFFRFIKHREWDISEMSFGKFVSLASQDDRSLVGIPVFPSRMFRLSSFYIRSDGRIQSPTDLRSARIGIPEWAQTASIYTRGYIAHELGIHLQTLEWVQAGVNEPGRAEKVALKLPDGIRYRQAPENSLNQMLLTGDIDVVLSARQPQAFTSGDPRVKRLFHDYRAQEEAHFRKSGIFPIMHVIAIRREVYEANPWIAMNLFKGFELAKNRALGRLTDITASQAPLPWLADYVGGMQKIFGEDLWPYGIEPNRRTLEAFLEFAWEQGVCHRRLAPEDLFAREVQSTVKV
jgi:4,5-dihydroxyphthalate decarboxylase